MCSIAIVGTKAESLFKWANLKNALGRAGIRLEVVKQYILVNQAIRFTTVDLTASPSDIRCSLLNLITTQA